MTRPTVSDLGQYRCATEQRYYTFVTAISWSVGTKSLATDNVHEAQSSMTKQLMQSTHLGYKYACNFSISVTSQHGDQRVNCTCKQGFHGNGVKCKENRDRCEDNGGGCSAYADCRYSPPPVTSEEEGQITCSCLPGYYGNGTLCVTTVLNALGQISATSAFQKVKF